MVEGFPATSMCFQPHVTLAARLLRAEGAIVLMADRQNVGSLCPLRHTGDRESFAYVAAYTKLEALDTERRASELCHVKKRSALYRCAWGPGPLVVPDTQAERYLCLALSTTRFFAGLPLIEEGVLIGVLAVFGDAPREKITAADLAVLRQVAKLARTEIVALRVRESVITIDEVRDHAVSVPADEPHPLPEQKSAEDTQQELLTHQCISRFSPDLTTLHDFDDSLTICHASSACRHMLGLSEQEVLGVSPYQLMHGEDVPQAGLCAPRTSCVHKPFSRLCAPYACCPFQQCAFSQPLLMFLRPNCTSAHF